MGSESKDDRVEKAGENGVEELGNSRTGGIEYSEFEGKEIDRD